ncbi:hypothetical protein KP509_23G036100 [Ceratopteris richardii]|nr:hypothetical protein KP509_23G036100 [Ceratopteris richardii]
MADSRNKAKKYLPQRKGYVPVILNDDRRAFIKISHLKHAVVLALLQETAREHGYSYDGPLRLPCDPDSVNDLLKYEVP